MSQISQEENIESWRTLWRELACVQFGATTSGEGCWRTCLHNASFRLLLRCSARRVLWRRGAPIDWQDDLENQALLELKRAFQRLAASPCHRAVPAAAFPSWITTVVTRACLQALRQLYRLYRREAELADWEQADGAAHEPDLRLDLRQALAALPEPTQAIIRSLAAGRPLVETAESLGISYKRARAQRDKGLAHLRRSLTGYTAEGRRPEAQ